MIDHFKEAMKIAGGYFVSFINFTVTDLNDVVALFVGILTSVYLVCQIRKSLKNEKRNH